MSSGIWPPNGGYEFCLIAVIKGLIHLQSLALLHYPSTAACCMYFYVCHGFRPLESIQGLAGRNEDDDVDGNGR